jgi:hypothetical protein
MTVCLVSQMHMSRFVLEFKPCQVVDHAASGVPQMRRHKPEIPKTIPGDEHVCLGGELPYQVSEYTFSIHRLYTQI